MTLGESILVQSNDNTNDDHQSIKARIDACKELDLKDPKKFKKQACEKWFDVRAFGQIFPFKGTKSGEGVSIPVRGPVSIHSAYSLEPVSISSIQITKSTNLEDTKAGQKRRRHHGHETPRGFWHLHLLWQHQLSARIRQNRNWLQ